MNRIRILTLAALMALPSCAIHKKPMPTGNTAKLQSNIKNVRTGLKSANGNADKIKKLTDDNRRGADKIDYKAMKALRFFRENPQ